MARDQVLGPFAKVHGGDAGAPLYHARSPPALSQPRWKKCSKRRSARNSRRVRGP
jgi:hypothetical protein